MHLLVHVKRILKRISDAQEVRSPYGDRQSAPNIIFFQVFFFKALEKYSTAYSVQ